MGKWLEEIDKWTDIVPVMAKIPVSAFRNRFNLLQIWKKVQLLLGYGNTQVVVLGRPGVGKSVIASQLVGEASDLSYKLPPPSRLIEKAAVRFGNPTKIISVIPGHDSKKRNDGLVESFNRHDLEGVIYVVDWGYTPVRENLVRQQMIEKGIDSIERLREFHLEQELSDFRNVALKIKEISLDGRGPKWLLIIVNKVDLFWQNLDDAERYYNPESSGDFASLIKELQTAVGKQNIEIAVVPVSAWPTEFIWNDHCIHPLIGGEDNRRSLIQHLIIRISEFIL